MRINPRHIGYALVHPLRAIRYLLKRDRIDYRQIAQYLPAAPTIVEAGAFDGTNTLEMAAMWPAATIHAFEPIPAAAKHVADRLRCFHPRVQCHPLGLGAVTGQLPMYVSGDGSRGVCHSSSFLAPTAIQAREFPDIRFEAVKTVPVVTLDDWALERGVGQVHFIWLDVQGYEMDVLDGATRLLPAVRAVHLEVCNEPLYRDAPLYPAVKAKMSALGFEPVIEAFFRVSGNVLFIRPQH